jgi:hypothetical protein
MQSQPQNPVRKGIRILAQPVAPSAKPKSN